MGRNIGRTARGDQRGERKMRRRYFLKFLLYNLDPCCLLCEIFFWFHWERLVNAMALEFFLWPLSHCIVPIYKCLSILPNGQVIFQMHSSKMLEREEQIFILCVSLGLWVGFPSGSDGKESACNKGDLGLIPGSGRSPGEGNGNPLQYACLENSMDRGAWWDTFSHRVGHEWITLSLWLVGNYVID